MLLHAGKRRYWKSPSPLTDLPTLYPHIPTTSTGGGPAGGVTYGPLSQQQSCHGKYRSLLCKVQSHVCCSNSNMDPTASHCVVEIMILQQQSSHEPEKLPSAPQTTSQLGWGETSNFRCMEKHCGLECNCLDLAELIQLLLKCKATLILTRLLLNWNYSTNVQPIDCL